jgi:hypothetical protein
MADLDKLEQLNRLKEAGVLTDAEFEQQKSQILSGPRSSSNPRIVGLIVLVVLLAAIFWFATRPAGDSDAMQAGQTALVSETAPTGSGPITSVKPDTPSESSLTFATSDAVIGVNPSYLEKKLGVPREKSKGWLVFEVGGCTINYTYDDRGVTGFYLDVTRSCQPIIRGRQVGPNTTFGSLLAMEKWGKYVASCLTSCGNAADPVIDLSYPGSRSTGLISISYSTDYSQAGEALELWGQALRKSLGLSESDTPEDYEAFSCVQNPPANVRTLLPRMTVKTVWVTNDNATTC